MAIDKDAVRGTLTILLEARQATAVDADAQLVRRLGGEAPAGNEEEDQTLAALHRELDGAVRAVTAALRAETQLMAVRARLANA